MRGMSKKDALACQVSLGLFAGLLGIASTAHGAPIADGGGVKQDGVRTGGAKIVQSGATTNITSDNTNNVIGWKDFSVKSGETVQFDGGANTNNYLNIVTGKVTSHIDGAMKGGKNVYIANSHGVVFGDGASVDVGSLYVTTRKLDADAIGTSVKNGTIDLDAPTSAGVTDNIINGDAASSAGLAKSDIVSLVDGSGSVKATKIVLEGKSVRIMNDAKIDSPDVSAVADQSALEVNAGGMKTVRANKGYVHVGYASSAPTYGSTGKYKNLTDANMYKLVGSKADLDAIRTTAGGLAGRYMLRNDIDFGGAAHTSIGTDADPFTGKFDGMFHEIKNMTVASGSAAEYAGLFGTTNGATIMNVGLKNADLSTVQYGGGLVGHAKGKTVISAVYNESTISIGAGNDAGGLVGWLDSSSLDNAYNKADVGHGGGLVGRFDGSSKMYAVYNTGAITLGVSSSAYKIYGNNVVTTGSDVAFIKDAYTNRVELTPSVNNSIIYNSYTMDSTGTASLVMPSGTPKTGDSKQSATYEGWDISDEGGANTTWRIFAGQSTPLLTAFMKGTVQAEYSYADFQQADHAHLGNTASTYTVQAEDKKNGSYVKRLGTESNGGKDITRTYNADYLRIAHKSGDNYTHVTSVGTTDDDIKLYGAKDRSLVELNKADSQGKGGGGGRRNAGREAMLVSGQHGYDIAGANVTIAKRKVIGDVGQMGKIQREYDGTANAGDAFKAALTAGNVVVRTEGLVDGDGATMTINTDGVTFREKGNWTSGAALSPNAGYNKSIYVDSSKVNFGDADGNYEFDATKINDKNLTGNILQKTIKAKLTTDTGINKTYDGTSKVLKAQYQPDPNLILDSSTPLVGTNDVTLNQADVTVKYKDKTTKAEVENAGTGHGVAYEGIKLKSTTAGMTKNYKLVDKEGNVLYREAIDDDPNAAAAVTSGGTLWGTGTIERRKLDASHFSITGASKIYDGKDYLLVDGTANKVEVAVNEDAGKATDTTQKGLVDKDKDNLKFTISAADGKAYYKNASNANTKDVYSATSPNGAQFLSYTLKASGSALQNYAFDDGATTKDLTTADTYDIKNAAAIKPREITVDLLKKTGIDKVYDKTTAVTDGTNGTTNNKLFGTNFGYAAGTTDDHKLVAGDGAEIKATSAVYKKKTSGLEAADKDVSRVGGTATGAVIENGKDVEYKIELTGADAAKAAAAAANYRLKYSVGTQTTNGTVGSAITMTGMGKITPRELALNNLPEVVRSYDRTSNVYAKQLKDKGYNSVTSDVGENVALTLGADTDVVGTYYESAAADAEKATDANYRSDGTTQISGKPAQYTVRYKSDFKPTITDGNYVLKDASTSTGTGKITTFVANSTNFKMDFGVQSKVFDGTAAAGDHNQLSKLELDFGNGQKLDFLHTPQKSYERIGEFGNEHANVDKDGNYLVIGGTTKTAYSFTFKVKPILGTNASDNYDLSALSPSADGYISMTKAAHGKIAQRKLQATLVNPQHEKVYDGTKDVTNGKGEKLTGSSIVLLDNLAPKENSGTYGDGSDIVGEYDNKNVQSNKHVVTYKLKISPNGYENDYYFVDKNNTVVTELKGEGVIKPREIDVDFNYARKTYDGTSAVDKSVPPSGTWGYTLKPHDESADMRTKVQTLLNNEHPTLNTAVLTGTYVGENGTTPQSDAGEYTDRVKYSNIQAALQDSNYKMVSDTRIGSGKIDKRTFNAADLNLNVAAARKTYDGTTLVKKAGGKAEDYITGLTMNLGGTPKTYVKNTDYSLKSATYANPNVSANTGTGSVTYTISLKKSDGTNGSLLNNYEFTNLPTGYSFDAANGTLSRTVANGTIDKRKVYAHVKDVSKIYNADIDVRGGSGNGHLLSSSELVTFDNKLNGTAVDDTGLIEAHKSLNATTASYRDKTAGTGNKTVDYTLSIDSDPAIAGNYAFHDGKTGAAVPVNGSGKYVLTTTTNTINRRALKIQTQAGVTKAFDNTDVVKVGNAPSTTGQGLSFVGGDKQGSDTVDLNTTYTRVYKSKNATKTAASKKNNIKYNNIQLTGADAANYYLADSTGKALDADTTLGFFKTTGDGEITPFQVTKNNFKLKFRTQPIKKTYDGTANVGVGDAAHNQPARWEDYITDSYVTDGGGTKLFDIDVEKVKSATYRNAGNTADDKNVGQNKKVLFNLKFSDAAQNNFDFSSDFYTPDADGNQMLSDGTYNRYTKGDIEKRVLQANLAHGADIRKVYDGTKAADKSNLSILNFVEADKDKLTTTATFDKATATVDPGAAATNTRQITYTATLTGDAADNYAFDTLTGPASKTLTATGDIERRKVYAKVTGAREKTYDADTKVLIGGTEREGEALVSFGKSADNNKDTGLLTGYGTNKTTAAYAGANAADASDTANKRVDYTLKIDGKDADGTDYANNYVVYDAVNPNTVVYNKAAGTNLGLTTTNNKIDRAPLYLTATHATKQYDGTKTVKKPETLLNITGGWQGGEGGNLNRTGTGSYTAEYQDANVNTKGVDYKNVKIVGTGTKPAKASNYYLSYNGAKLTPSSSETYALHGTGDITKRQLTGGALKVGFKTDPIRKYYDGTADVKSPAPKTYVNNIRATYKDENNHDQTIDVKNYTVERADYLAKSADAAAKDVGKGKDVKFQFAMNDGNFDYSGVTGATLGADGVYRFSQNYDREVKSDGTTVGRGEIIGRRVALTLHLVQKVYDGTKDVKNGYYTKDAKTGKLVEHNPNLDWKKVITLDGDGKIGGDENSGFAHGEKLDFNATGEYKDANANRDPHYTGAIQPANKDVTYKMRLKDATANKNYTFQIRVVDEAGNTLKTATSQSFIDPQTGEGHMFDGLGNIWQKQLTLTKTNGWGKNYDGNANVTDAVKKGLQFDGVAQSDKGFFNFSDPANARANTFAGKLSGRYGDRAVEGSFLDTPGNTAVYKHVKRPQGNLNGTPEARDVELTGVKDALASLQTPGSVANNYFYDGDNTVYGTGVIKPLTLDLKKTWLKNGADFSKTYDGDPLAKIGGKALSPENKQAFHDKLKLSVDLGTGEKPIELDYTLYGDEKGDYEGYRPHYENLSGGHAHHGQSDANVKNSADPADTLNKDIVYKLKRINGDKAWANQAEGARYKDWELSENPSGADLRLSDAATDTHTDNKSGLRAVITPRKVEVQADAYSKIYDGTSSLTAPSLSAGELAKKQQELRSKLHVTDKEAAKMLKDDGIDFTVDTAASHFLNKDSREADADVARDAKGNVLKDAKGNVLKDGKLVEYRLQKTGDAVKQGNYELPSAALPSGVQTDTVLGTGSITPRIVRVAFDPASTAAPDKIYDGTQYAVKDGKIHSRTFKLVDAVGDEGVVAADAGDVKLNQTHNVGKFASPNVKKDKNGVQAQDVTYHEGIELTNGNNKAGNYKLVKSNLKDSAKITPRPITATLKHEPIVKEYDGTETVKDFVRRTSAGKVETTLQREGNINLVDKNAKVTGISAPAQPTWEAKDKARGMTLTKAEYDNKNVGKNKRVTYDIAMNSDNYMLVDAAGSSLMSGDRKAQITSDKGQIDRRKVFVGLGKSADKVYDGNRVVRDALDDLSFTYNGTGVESPQKGLVAEEAQKVKKALRVSGVYTDDADAAKNDSEEYKHHKVRYTFEKDETRDPILANYEITTKNGNNTIDDTKGIIRRRTLNVVPDSQATYERRGNVNYTGHIEDGSKAANRGSDLTQEVKNDLQRFNSGVFTYGPTKGSVDYDTPDWNELQGWYMRDGKKTLASGAYDKNYTLNPVPARLFVAPRTDGVDRTLRPDGQVYVRASYDENDTFGAHRGSDASLAYTGTGVNYGGMKPQQGTSTNAGDAGIRQQGTGTNIGSSAGASGAAVANGKVQGATGAVNEAARAAGAQPGTSVKPQGAQSGAAVKPQGTTGGNAALAGGTAGSGGYYSPSAQPGVSVKPQGAQSGAAAKSQSAASAVGSAGRTGGAGSVVDRGLAAAAGVSVGSSSDARTGASGSRRSADYSSAAGFYADGSSRAADRGLANALGKGVGSAGYYSGKGYSHTNDDEEEEIKKKTKASA